jgi:hypothetical protein
LFFFIQCLFLSPVYGGDVNQMPESFTLELHVGDGEGLMLSGPLGLNDDLLVRGQVPQLGDSLHPVLSNLIWQVYTISGTPLPEFNKTRQILGLGQQEFCSFRIQAGALANGVYFIALTHQLAQDPAYFYQASASFEINQPLAVKQVVIDETPQGKFSQRIFYEDQSPHIFVYYYLADNVYSALIEINVLDESGKVRASRTIRKDKDLSKKRERVGIKLPPGLFKAGEKAVVLVKVTTPDGTAVSVKSGFEILAIDLGIHLPDSMIQGTVADFQLFVPQTFHGPYKIEFEHDDGFIFKHKKGGLEGKLFVTPVAETGSHNIEILVTDRRGNRASGHTVVEVVPGAVHMYQRKIKKHSSEDQQGGHIGSSTRR